MDFKWHYNRYNLGGFIEAVCVPDKDDFDFERGALDDGGCILVTVAIKDLPIDLTK